MEDLKFVLLNLKNRESGLSNTSFSISQMPNEAAMDKQQLQQLIANGEMSADGLSAKITAYTQSISGSPSYWWKRKHDVTAMIHHQMLVTIKC